MVPRIDKEYLQKRLNEGGFTLLDVRNPVDYAASDVEIPGAIRMPLDELPERINELDPGKEVIAYCT